MLRASCRGAACRSDAGGCAAICQRSTGPRRPLITLQRADTALGWRCDNASQPGRCFFITLRRCPRHFPFAPIDAAPGLPGRGVVGVRAVGEPNTQWRTAFSGCAAVPEPTRSGWQCHALGAVACQDRWRRKSGEHQQCSTGCLAGQHAPRRSWSSAWSIGLRLLRALGKAIAVVVGRLAGVPVTARGRSRRRNRSAWVLEGAMARAYATWATAAGLNTLSE